MRSSISLLAFGGVAMAAIGNYTVDPDTVPIGQASDFCNSQIDTCVTLCNAGGDGPNTVSCETSDLEYECTCNNGTAPGLQYYTGSMESMLCEESYSRCVDDNVGSLSDQTACQTDIRDKCGSLDPATAQAAEEDEPEATASASASATSDSEPATETGDNAGDEESSDDDSAAVSVQTSLYANFAGAIAVGLMLVL